MILTITNQIDQWFLHQRVLFYLFQLKYLLLAQLFF